MRNKFKNFSLSDENFAIVAIITSTVFVGLILISLIKFFGLHDHVRTILEWIDSAGFWAPLIFILIDTLVVIFLLPGVLITMGAGFLFGLVKGSIYIVIATTLGAAISFTIARYAFKEKTAKFFLSHKRAQYLNKFFAADGWKIIFMTRLIPFFPFKLSNYLFGLTKFKMRSFILGTFLGIWPITIFNVYVGSLASSLAKLGDVSEANNAQLYFYIFGFVCTIIAIFYITSRAKLALNRYLETSGTNE